jgi:anti-sigma factor RsiW
MSKSDHPAGHVLQAFHDGELKQAPADEVGKHLQECELCRAELADLRRVADILQSAPTPEPSGRTWARMQPENRVESRLSPAFVLAACAAGIVLGVLLGPHRFGPDETGTDSAWSETVTVWNGSSTSSLLSVYQTAAE